MRITTLLTSLVVCATASAQQPNVLLVIADDLGVDKLGAYAEHPTPGTTPTLDLLAQGGLLFRNAWSHPTCSPTRAGMLTGRYPFRTGIGFWIKTLGESVDLSVDEVSLADVLGVAGYRTAAIGKWHLSAIGSPNDYLLHPLLLGFEHHWGPIANLPHVPNSYDDFEKVVDGTLTQATKYATTDQVDDAITMIQSFGNDPWFLWLAFNAPHKPLHAPPPELHSFQLMAARLPDQEGEAQLASAPSATAPTPTAPTGAVPGPRGSLLDPPALAPLDVDENAALYMKAMTEAMDTEIGRLLAAIPPATLAQTFVIFVGDNGTQGDAIEPPWDPAKDKGTMFEGGVNVPLIVSGPGVVAGGECSALVHTTDLFATIAEIAGADGSAGLDSLSLAPYFSRPGRPWLRSWVYTEKFLPNGPDPWDARQQSARNARYKYWQIEVEGFLAFQYLYDLEADPFETVDLMLAPLSPQAQAAYDELLAIVEGIDA